MNLLIHDPPTELEIGGILHPIDFSYRNCLSIIQFCESDELTKSEKVQLVIEWLYEEVPQDLNEAAQKAVWFLDCGETGILNTTKHRSLMSLEQDAKFIRSAIERTHHIRLTEVDLHWWEFCYMLMDLDSECFLHRIIGIRLRLAKGKKLSPEDREFLKENPQIVKLQNAKSKSEMLAAKEKEADLIRLMEGGK